MVLDKSSECWKLLVAIFAFKHFLFALLFIRFIRFWTIWWYKILFLNCIFNWCLLLLKSILLSLQINTTLTNELLLQFTFYFIYFHLGFLLFFFLFWFFFNLLIAFNFTPIHMSTQSITGCKWSFTILTIMRSNWCLINFTIICLLLTLYFI